VVVTAPAGEGKTAAVQSKGHSHGSLVLTGILVLVSLFVAGGILLHSKNSPIAARIAANAFNTTQWRFCPSTISAGSRKRTI